MRYGEHAKMIEEDEFEGFRRVQITIYKIPLGDGSFRFCEEYSSGSQKVGGVEMATLQDLETRVRDNAALDWTTIAEHLKDNDSWSTVIHIHEETAAQLFGSI